MALRKRGTEWRHFSGPEWMKVGNTRNGIVASHCFWQRGFRCGIFWRGMCETHRGLWIIDRDARSRRRWEQQWQIIRQPTMELCGLTPRDCHPARPHCCDALRRFGEDSITPGRAVCLVAAWASPSDECKKEPKPQCLYLRCVISHRCFPHSVVAIVCLLIRQRESRLCTLLDTYLHFASGLMLLV